MAYKTNLDLLKTMAEQRQGRFWSPKSGINNIRFLPPYSEKGVPYKKVWVHYGIGEGNSMVICPKKMTTDPEVLLGDKVPMKRCPICALAEKLFHSEDPRSLEKAKAISAKPRYYYNILDLDNLKAGVQVYSAPAKIHDDLAKIWSNPKFGDVFDPQKGFDFTLHREGSGITSRYSLQISAPERTSIPDVKLLDELINLDQLVKLEDYDTINFYLNGVVEDEDGEGEPSPSAGVNQDTAGNIDDDLFDEIGPTLGGEEDEEEDMFGLPSCFGKSFSEGDELCAGCSEWEACKREFNKSRAKRKPVTSSV